MARRLVLASASPARRRLLVDAGFDPEVIVSGVDESAVDAADCRTLVAVLAERKALAVVPHVGGSVVIGCDSMLEFEGESWGKPADVQEGIARWRRMRGRQGLLMTGHFVVDGGTGAAAADVGVTTVRFGSPSDTELDVYMATGEPLQVAGGFTLDGRSSLFIEGIDGDPSNVIGLSLPLLRALLERLDLSVTDFWS
ncbi:MAG: Maf family protein [Acidimicrobiales bacterium]